MAYNRTIENLSQMVRKNIDSSSNNIKRATPKVSHSDMLKQPSRIIRPLTSPSCVPPQSFSHD